MNPDSNTNNSAETIPDPNGPIIEDATQSANDYIVKNDKPYMFLIGVFTVVCFIIVIYFSLDFRLLFIPFVVIVAAYLRVQNKFERAFMIQFAASIGFTFSPSAGIDTVDGRFFKIGHSQSLHNVLTGNYKGIAMRMFDYQYTIGYGKGSQTYNCTICESTYQNMMPDISLDHGFGSAFGSSLFDNTETIRLEGDFNKYFTLRVPKGFETEAYQIFTPDVMADLIDRAKDISFEFKNNHIYIIAGQVGTTRTAMQNMFDLAEYLDDLFAKNISTMNISDDAALRN